jgi:MFS family permease
MAIGLLPGTVPPALIGFALLGLGSGCISPTVIALAGNQPDVPPGRGVAVVGLGEWPAFLLGPPVIGALAGVVTLRGALGLLFLSAVGIALLATRLAVQPRPREQREPREA